MQTKEKIVYKVWDKKNEKFICPNGKKSQWNSLIWAAEALKDMVRPGYCSTHLRRNPDEFEVQAFKLVMVESIPGRDAYEAKEKKAEAEKQKRKEINKIQNEINDLVPGVDGFRIRQMLKNGMFSEVVTKKLKALFDKLARI